MEKPLLALAVDGYGDLIPGMEREESRSREWLETDGLGGFASGTVSGVRTRRYHGLLVTATTPPTGRLMLVSGLDARVDTPDGAWTLSAERYAPDVLDGDGERLIEGFALDPWPTWTFQLPDGTRIVQEILMRAGVARAFVAWRLLTGPRGSGRAPAGRSVRLRIRPFFAGRDFHTLMHESDAVSLDPEIVDGPGGTHCRYRPHADGLAIAVSANGVYRHEPHWYRRFVYDEERRRGLDFEEDLPAPGEWTFDLGHGEAAMVFAADASRDDRELVAARDAVEDARATERMRRAALGGPLDRAADQYLVRRQDGLTLIAGYPWFGDWGRDTFIAMRGLCLATKRIGEAIQILSAWAGLVSEGMLPNHFPEGGSGPEYNAVDASLWFVIAAGETISAAGPTLDDRFRRRVVDASEAILSGYTRGTRYGIRVTADGLLSAGVPRQQLTWMDARVDGREVTPRVGKPVEVQALWLNALAAAATLGTKSAGVWTAMLARGRTTFEDRFWDDAHDRLYDVVDVDDVAGAVDASFRPNQILAIGGLPLALIRGERARRIVAAVEEALLTPLGLRTLAPGASGYSPRYQGGVSERDRAYHQGTVWPWLMGPFVEAWVRVHGGTPEVKRAARERFLPPLFDHLKVAGLGHVSEVADAESPHTPRGCPFQAWSLGELLRLDRVVLRVVPADGHPSSSAG